MIEKYFDEVVSRMEKIKLNEKEKIKLAARKVADVIMNDCIIHLFGCGHSHILTEEVFYRAGGLVPISPIFHEPLMLHEGAVISSDLERKNDYAQKFIKEIDIRENDLCFVLSTSGRNPVPVDVVEYMHSKKAYVIGITSIEYSSSLPSRHKNGKHLYEAVDMYIDNYSPKGDAVLSYEKVKISFTPSSTITGAFILNSIFAEAITLMANEGMEPPVFLSGNLEESDEHNTKLIEKYSERIPLLKPNK